MATTETRAVWTAAFINTLPDSSFLYIEPGGTKDGEGKTTPRSLRHFPVKDSSGTVDMPHLRNALSRIPQSNLPAAVKAAATKKAQGMMPASSNGGRSNVGEVFRAMPQGLEVRQAEDGGSPTLVGTLAVFDQWTEINSRMEGHFLERMAPGAFDKTINENRDRMRVLFNHGKDPSIGEKPLGPIARLEPDSDGVHAEVPLLDTSYNRDIAEMAKADPPVLGMSFRFEVLREDYNRKPARSQANPKGLPERTVQEVRMMEFGPVTFPAYSGTKVGMRSITDRMTAEPIRALVEAGFDPATVVDAVDRLDAEDMGTLAAMIAAGSEYLDEQDESDDEANIPRMEAILASLSELMQAEAAETEPAEDEEDSADLVGETRQVVEPPEPGDDEVPADAPEEGEADTAPPDDRAAIEHPVVGRRDKSSNTRRKADEMTIEEVRARRDEIKDRFRTITAELGAEKFDAETRDEWNLLREELDEVEQHIRDHDERQQFLTELSGEDSRLENEAKSARNGSRFGPRGRVASRVPDDIFDIPSYRNLSNNDNDARGALRDGALKAIERAQFPHPNANREDEQGNISKLLDTIDADGALAQRVLRTENPGYKRAFWKHMSGRSLTPDEQRLMGEASERALGIGSQGGSYPVPVTLDPTVIRTSNQVINPMRGLARIETITGDLWYGVSSAGVTATYGAEAIEASDGSPTLLQPSAQVEKAKVFVPFSIEVGEDWGRLQAEMAGEFQDAKDVVESSMFLTGLGHGSNQPTGLLVGATGTIVTAATATFAVADLYSLEQGLAPRWIPNASFVANRTQLNKIRQFDSYGGASLWVQLGNGIPPRLLDYPTYQWSDMSALSTTGSSIMIFGDFSKFLIVDRVGMNVELVPHLFGTTYNYPTGQRGLFAYWRNTSAVLTANAFKTLKLL